MRTRAAVISVHDQGSAGELGALSGFREAFYDCLSRRADALFELADAVLCAEGPVSSLVGLSLAAEHRRGHGALYDAVNAGRIEVGRLRRVLAGLPIPRDRQGRIVLGWMCLPGCVRTRRPPRIVRSATCTAAVRALRS
jgi:hypothetical protein